MGATDLVHVRAPATSANLGPAFDAAGIALDWWDELEVRRAPVDAIQVSGEQAELLPTGPDNLVAVAMRRLAAEARVDLLIGRRNPLVSLIIVVLVLLAGGAVLFATGGFTGAGNVAQANLNVPP